MSESEPSDEVTKRPVVVKIRSISRGRGQVQRAPNYCLCGNRHKGGMTFIQALLWNHRKPICYAKRKTQAGSTCELITDEHIGDG
jgi:hypothetical protein